MMSVPCAGEVFDDVAKLIVVVVVDVNNGVNNDASVFTTSL